MKPRNTATLILSLAVSLRVLRALCRWDEWALHYAGYYEPVLRHLTMGRWEKAVTTWTGLHPPLYGMVYATLSWLYSAPGLWLLFSMLCSVVAVLAVLKSQHPMSWLAGLLLATDPVQLHYAAEVNNYPLLAALIGLAWWARSRGRWFVLGMFGVLGAWTHVLGGVTIGLMALTSTLRWRTLLLMAAGVAPLVPGGLEILTDVGNQRQPPMDILESATDALSRFSPSFLLLLPLLFLGALKLRGMAAVWTGTALFWVLMVAMGIGAPHQFPYAIALGVPAVVLIAAAHDHRLVVRSLVAVCLLRGAWVGAQDSARLALVWTDADAKAAVSHVMDSMKPGDAIVLVRGLSEQDDDKRHTSAVLWRFPPWETMKDPVLPRGQRHLMGNPRRWRAQTLYTFDEPRPIIQELEAKRVFTLAYGAAAESGDIPRHSSQGGWQYFGEIAVRFPKTGPASSAHD